MPRYPGYGEDIEAAAKAVREQIAKAGVDGSYPPRWLALKLMEGDSQICEEINPEAGGLSVSKAVNHLKKTHYSDMESVMADARYGVAGLAREVVRRSGPHGIELTERIDRVALNRFLGIPLFFAAMWFVFKLTFDVSKPFADWMSAMASGPLKAWAQSLMALIAAPAG